MEYFLPGSLQEALQLKKQYGREAGFIAGGTDVMVNVRNGKEAVSKLISINRLSELNYIRADAAALRIGALTTHTEIAASELIQAKLPILADASSQVGSHQIRNVATVGGNICSSLPSADTAPPLLAADAQIVLASLDGGRRQLDLAEFFTGPGKNALREDEMLLEFIVPLRPGACGAYCKMGRRKAMELPLVAAAVSLVMDGKVCVSAGIALATAAPTSLKVKKASAFLAGRAIDADTLLEAGKLAAQESSPRSSFRGDAGYRRDVIPILVRDAGLKALQRRLG